MSDNLSAVSSPVVPCLTGSDLRAWRQSLQLNQTQFASLLDVHVRTVYRYERMQTLDRLTSLAVLHLRDCRGMGGHHAA